MPNKTQKIGAVILAAGESSRFGRPKQLVQFRRKSLVCRVAKAAIEAGCSPVVVVIGSDGEKVARELAATSVTKIENKNWQRGIGSSIRIGMQALIKNGQSSGRAVAMTAQANSTLSRRTKDHHSLEAVVLLVCDQPFVDANTIRSLIALRQTTEKDIIASSYANTLGVPALFDGSLFQELLSLGDEAGAKPIILRNRKRVAKLPFPEGKVDIDSWTDWKKVNERSYPERSGESHTS